MNKTLVFWASLNIICFLGLLFTRGIEGLFWVAIFIVISVIELFYGLVSGKE